MSTCSNADFPFLFFDGSGEQINGTLSGDSCIFPDANCNGDFLASECCALNTENGPVPTGSAYVHIAWVFVLYPFIWAIKSIEASMTPEEKAIYEQEEEENKPKIIMDLKLPPWLENFLLLLWSAGLSLYMTAMITIGIMYKQTVQRYMSVSERTTLAAAEAFMVPFKTIFTFIEDIVMIRVMYALQRKDKELTDRLIHMGLAKVIIMGIIAGIFGTVLAISDPVLRMLTNPGYANDKALYPGCEQIDKAGTDLKTIFPYWMLEAWDVMALQITGVLAGYMNGAFEYGPFGWVMSISLAIFSGIFFPNIATSYAPVTLLGIAEFARDWSQPILLIAFIKSPLGRDMCERTGLNLQWKKVWNHIISPFRRKSDTDNNDGNAAERKEEKWLLLKQGAQLLFIDASVQAWYSCSTYLSLRADSAVGYQLTAFQSEIPVYTSFSTAMSVMVKFMGPLLLANSMPKIFVNFVNLNVLATIFSIILVNGITIPFFDNIAIISGTNACQYASSSECIPYFDKVFGLNGGGGLYTLIFTYKFFSVATSLDIAFLMFRSFLIVCLDFHFMTIATAVACVFYVPAIGVVQYTAVDFQEEAIGYLVAYYVPKLVLILLYGVRIIVVNRKISRGEPGPWSPKQEKRATRLASMDPKMTAAAIEAAGLEAAAANYHKVIGVDDEKSA